MTTISATSILASQHALDPSVRGDTMLWRYPRCIHSEVMTHRMFSRNASSSRAIPVEKLIQDALDDPFIPLFWGKNQKGMQADQECHEPVLFHNGSMLCDYDSHFAWLQARDYAVKMARAFAAAGYHKQLVNRLLEPFTHITVVVTSTNWSNFLALRDHKDAEPHIQMLARAVREAYDTAEVQILNPGVWHMPWITPEEHDLYNLEQLKKLSVARCASTSYKTVEGFDMTLERAEAIYDKLFTMKPIHASPFEHVFQMDFMRKPREGDQESRWFSPYLGGNLGPGVIQLRKTLPGECL